MALSDSQPDDSSDQSAEVEEVSVTARGGANEVGRSCYHVEIAGLDVLVDCGLRQTTPVTYPNFQGIKPESIDAVFVTHSHIDHTGALPLLEANNLLAEDASILATRPTATLTNVLLRDSLKLHKRDAEQRGMPQRFTQEDLSAVLDRFKGRPYGHGVHENITYQFGNAGHLLGSAWLALEHDGKRILFSGDLGGRSAHLPDIDTPPSADALFLESTYGDLDTHRSFSTARTTLWEEVVNAVQNDIPVLIPTFAVGRAQEVLQVFRERMHTIEDDETRQKMTVVYDGMITDSMETYNAFVRDMWYGDSFTNYAQSSGDSEPFLPDTAFAPSSLPQREGLTDGEGGSVPVIVASSGMLVGGWSPWYLWRLAENYDDARVFLIGYQAAGTPGRRLQNLAHGESETLQFDNMFRSDADGGVDVEFEVPRSWVGTINGFSGHAARNHLLQFARDVDPATVHLIHGESGTISEFRDHLQQNLDAMVSATDEGVQIPIQWGGTKQPLETDAETPDAVADSLSLPDGDNDEPFTPAQEERLRELIRDELQNMMLDAFADGGGDSDE